MESPLREFGQQELQPAQREPEVGEDNRTHSHLAVAGFAGERLSVMTTESSVDLRTATIEHAEKAVVRPAHVQAHSYDASASEAEERPKMPARAATIDSVPQDEQASRAGVPLEDMKSALEQFMDDVTSDAGSIVSGHREREGDFTPGAQRIRLEAVTQGITAGTFAVPVAPEERVDDAELEDDLRSEAEDGDEDDEAHAGEDADTSLEEARADREAEPEADVQDHAQPPQLAPIPSIAADLSAEDAPGPSSAAPAVLSPTSTSAPAVSKVSRRSREEAILEKRREVRRRDEDQRMGLTTPPRDARPLNTSIRRPKPRRSMSAGGAGGEEEGLLDVRGFTATQDPLAETIGRALRKLDGPTKAVSMRMALV